MFITIDGPPGSGSDILCAQLINKHNFESINFRGTRRAINCFHQVSAPRIDPRSILGTTLAYVPTFHLIQPTHDRDVVIDAFWSPFLDAITTSSDGDAIERNINFFRTAMTLNNQKEPDLSVILEAPSDFHVNRLINDSIPDHNEVKIANTDTRRNDAFYDSANKLAELVPYIKFIDNTQPAEEVAASIMEL